MCYRIPADAAKDVSGYHLSSKKESVSTPRKDELDALEKSSLLGELDKSSSMSDSGVAAMFHKLLAPFGNDKGGTWRTDDIEMEINDDKREVEKIG